MLLRDGVDVPVGEVLLPVGEVLLPWVGVLELDSEKNKLIEG